MSLARLLPCLFSPVGLCCYRLIFKSSDLFVFCALNIFFLFGLGWFQMIIYQLVFQKHITHHFYILKLHGNAFLSVNFFHGSKDLPLSDYFQFVYLISILFYSLTSIPLICLNSIFLVCHTMMSIDLIRLKKHVKKHFLVGI